MTELGSTEGFIGSLHSTGLCQSSRTLHMINLMVVSSSAHGQIQRDETIHFLSLESVCTDCYFKMIFFPTLNLDDLFTPESRTSDVKNKIRKCGIKILRFNFCPVSGLFSFPSTFLFDLPLILAACCTRQA